MLDFLDKVGVKAIDQLHLQQIVCHICDSDAAIYFTGTAEQCLQYLQEQDEMFAQLPQVMILTEEKYMTMSGCG